MSKKKVHQVAKELGLDNKVFIEELKKLGIEVTSHLNALSDEDMAVIEKNKDKFAKASEAKKSEKVEKKATSSKPSNPTIIRREIKVIDKDQKPVEKKEEKNKEDIGIVRKEGNKDFKIMNRSRQKTQVGSIADLFKKPDTTSSNATTEKTVEQTKKQGISPSEILARKNSEQNTQKVERPIKQNFEKKPNQQNIAARPERKDNNNNNNNFKSRKIEKDIKNVITAPAADEKQAAQKEYTQRNKAKQNNNQDEQKRPMQKHGRQTPEHINMGKIKDLKSQNSLSGMFNDSDDGMLDYYDLSHAARNNKANKKNKKKEEPKREFEKNVIYELTDIKIPEFITVKALAEAMKKPSGEVIKKLFGLGIMATINQEIDFDTAYLVAQEFNINAEKLVEVKDEDILFDDTEDDEKDLQPRPPVVVVMGHVDHGKTSLLDAVRSTNVIENEAGGITQHIGAYRVRINNRDITFLDTPGHEAFTAMRARGAQVTDIAILVVAADDGIMPQTVEAINHAKAANVPIIVAINKIDKEGANVERVKEALTEYELVPEEWGGDTICVPISAKKRIGIDNLLEMVLLVADMQNLRANPNKQAKGTVIESRLDKNKGVITTLLVQRGTLNVGDTIVLGNAIGKIRAMVDDKGKKIKKAGPSTPVEITGLPEVSEGGDVFYEVENEKVAKHLIEQRKIKQREHELRANNRVTLDDLFSQIEEGKIKELNLIVKADVQGSAEAIKQSLLKLSTDEVRVKVIHANVGAITQTDVTLAKVANAIIIGFNVRPDVTAKATAESEGVDIKLYSVIYNAIDDVKKAMKGLLDPKFEEEVTGTAEVRNIFKVSSIGTIAGSYVLNGKIVRNGQIRLIRDGVVIYTGKIASLRRFKDDAKEVAAGYECGIQIENYNDLKEQDQIECFVMKEIKDE